MINCSKKDSRSAWQMALVALATLAFISSCARTRTGPATDVTPVPSPSAPAPVVSADPQIKLPNPQPVVNQPPGSKPFAISRLEITWSGPVGDDPANHRTVMYGVKACIDDVSANQPAAGVEFSIQLADKTTIKKTASSMKDIKGCVEWEDKITHFYYEPERWVPVSATISHESGYSETRDYVVAPWQRWNFTVDPVAKGDFIRTTNERPRLPSRFLADGLSFDTQNTSRYDVDDFLSLTYIKRVLLQIPMRAFRPSNILDGANMSPEPLRPGRYLLKAAFVAPVQGVGDRQAHLLISPMIGLNRIVTVRGGAVYADVEFPINDVRLMNSRAYLAFELYLVDEDKIPKDDPFLTKSAIDPMSVVDRHSQMISPTFIGAMNLKIEKDMSFLVPTTDLALDLPTTDPVYKIPRRTTTPPDLKKAVEPLAGLTVDRLYELAKADQEAYRGRIASQRSLGLVADHANAEFAFVNEEARDAAGDAVLLKNNQILPPADRALPKLLEILNEPLVNQLAARARNLLVRPAKTDQQTLMTLIGGHTAFDPHLAAQLCGYFFYTLPRTQVTGARWKVVEYGASGHWMDLCLAAVRDHGPDGVFSVDHRIRVLQSAGTQWVRGRSFDVHVGASVGFSKTKTASQSFGVGFGTSGLMGELSKRALLAKEGSKVLRIFTSTAGALGLSADISRTDSSSTSLSGGATFDIGQTLSVEQNEIRVSVTKSDECIVIRPRPKMFEGRSAIHLKLMKEVLGDLSTEKLMSRGLMLCGGLINTKARSVPERYYTFGFKTSGGNALDAMNVANLPWLLSIRGQRDFVSFLLLASGQKITMKEAKAQELDLGDLATGDLQDAYDKYFAGEMSTIPGFITAEPKVLVREKK